MIDVKSLIPCREIDEALAVELINCQKALRDVCEKILTKYKQSEAYKMRKSFASTMLSWQNTETMFVEGNCLNHTFSIPDQKRSTNKVKTFIHESTVNVLLGSKLLTDAQKLVLANQITDGLFENLDPIPGEVVKPLVQEEYERGLE